MTAASLKPGVGLTERLVALSDGRRIRVVEAGEADPLVVFEAGLGAAAGEWVAVQRLVAAHTRTVSYDRAGHGGSGDDAAPRTVARIVSDLNQVLDAVGATRPVILVGHSWGGPVLRLFAERHPDRVAGLVFVDATVSQIMDERQAHRAVRLGKLVAVLGRLGLAGLLRKITLPDLNTSGVSADDQQIMLREFTSRRSVATGLREAAQIIEALPTLRCLQTAGLPDIPVAALVGKEPDVGARKLRSLMIDTTRSEMADHPQGAILVVAGAGHLVPQQRPHETAAAILDLVRRTTGRRV